MVGLRSLRPAARQCMVGSGAPSEVRVRLSIDGGGFATYLGSTPTPPTEIEACLRNVIAGARFRATGGDPFNVDFPYTNR